MRAKYIFEMAKNTHSKYYAPDSLVKFVINKTLELVPIKNITQIIEPAAGDRAFMPYLDAIAKNEIDVRYYDLDPDPSNPRIKKQDFLTLQLVPSFSSSRLVITGPPYGERNKPATTKLWKQFAQKASEIAGYVVFIAPVSWLDIKHPVSGLTCIYQKDMGKILFRGSTDFDGTDHYVKTAVLIYKTENIDNDDEDYSKVERDFKIHVFQAWKDERSSEWDYYVNGWGLNSGEISKRGISRTNTPFSRAIVIKVINDFRKVDLDNWLKTFEKEYKDQIEKYSANTDNIIALKRFKKWLKDALYKK